jgi:triosephosphate isomerase
MSNNNVNPESLETSSEVNLETSLEVINEVEDVFEGMVEPFFIGLNWKTNPSSWSEASNLLSQYQDLYAQVFGDADYLESLEISIIPPVIYLSNLIELSEDIDLQTIFSFGLQDLSANGTGAYTGQIAGEMGANLGVSEVLVGHSETRKELGFTNQVVAQKVKQALDIDLQPIIAVGHSDQTSQEINLDEISEQTKVAVSAYLECPDAVADIIVAYEPVWCIGTGKTPTNEQISSVFETIEQVVEDLKVEVNLRLIYGGSVDDKNVDELLKIEKLSGFLIGGASLKPEKLLGVFKAVKKVLVEGV